MAEKDILQNMIFQLGQSQDQRRPAELDVHFAEVDERTPEDLLRFLKKLAAYINYYRTDISKPAGDWSPFFPDDETTLKQLLASATGSTPPHLALLLAFLELYRQPQALINQITGRHCDFYFKEVLRLTTKAAVPDKAHVLLELKKNAAPISIGPANLFAAGKDATGVELIYAPSGDTVINRATVDSLRSVFLDSSNLHGAVRYAPVANSSDGVGGELTGDEPRWRGFGYAELPPAEVGFAMASPVLRLQEGARTVTVTLALNNVDRAKLTDTTLNAAFEGFITGAKHWLGPYSLSPTLSLDNILQFQFIIPESEPAVVDYDIIRLRPKEQTRGRILHGRIVAHRCRVCFSARNDDLSGVFVDSNNRRPVVFLSGSRIVPDPFLITSGIVLECLETRIDERIASTTYDDRPLIRASAHTHGSGPP